MVLTQSRETSNELSLPSDGLRRAFDWVEKTKELPPQFAIAIYSTIWLQRVAAFRNLEDELLARDEYTKELDGHRAVLSQLIAEGEQFVFAAKRLAITKFPSGCSLGDLQATIDSLHLTFRCQHGPRNPKKTEGPIAELLNVA